MVKGFSFLLILISVFASCTVRNYQPQSPASKSAWALLPFVKADAANPILVPDTDLVFRNPILNESVQWAAKDVFNPATVVRNDTVFLLFRAEDTIGKYAGTSRIGLAYSTDGLHFTKYFTPVLYPENDAYKKWEWEGGCEDPRVVQDEAGTCYMTYTAYNGDKAILMVATSTNLYQWQKHGPVFADAYGGKYANFWSKSGAIVSTYESGKIVATKINNKYWMYWGDQNIWAATSDDLIHWTPVLNTTNENISEELQRGIAQKAPELKVVFGPRKGKFDSDLVESGPPAMITNEGIVLIYNSRNIPAIGDTSLLEGTYAAGQVLIDKSDPTKVIDRLDHYFIKPDKPYELSGQVNNVCFVEGLAQLHGKWFLYYGTADAKIAVAVKE